MIDLDNISLQFGGKYLFRNVSFRIFFGDRISLVGANGTGKSSLLKIINGELIPENGEVRRQKNTGIGYLPQEQLTHSDTTLIDEAKSALTDILELKNQEDEITSLLEQCSADYERNEFIIQLGEIHNRYEMLEYYSSESRIEKILTGLGFRETDFTRLTNEFSGGWQMRIALSKILIRQNDMLLLDEPTNHLDLDSLQWLTSFLRAYKGALLIVSHDKHFINAVTDKTLEIFSGKFYSYSGNYDDYLKYKEDRDKQTVNQMLIQQRKIKETERFIERFRYKATKAKQVQSRVKQLEKIELIEIPESGGNINIRFPETMPSGIVPVKLLNVSKSFGEKQLFRNITFELTRGEKIAFVGPNGAGKTTLAKIIAGIIPFTGERIIGKNTMISYYSQDVADELDPDLDILETVENVNEEMSIGQLRSLLGTFLFRGDDVFKKAGVLSGGEKSRVALARILLQKSNLLILDEPTNHLDISSVEILQKALIKFKGSLIVVSHDVDFLQPLVSKVLKIEDGTLHMFYGGIDYYLSKTEDSVDESSGQNITQTVNSRKERKRTEAEQRQKKYQATKQLLQDIAELEAEIDNLEEKYKEIEIVLADPDFYTRGDEVRQKNIELRSIKALLDDKMWKWSSLSEKLAAIERKFS